MLATLFHRKCMQFSGPSGEAVASLQEGQDCKLCQINSPACALDQTHAKNWSWFPKRINMGARCFSDG